MNWITGVKKVYDGCTGCEYYRITYANKSSKEVSVKERSKALIVLMEELVFATTKLVQQVSATL